MAAYTQICYSVHGPLSVCGVLVGCCGVCILLIVHIHLLLIIVFYNSETENGMNMKRMLVTSKVHGCENRASNISIIPCSLDSAYYALVVHE